MGFNPYADNVQDMIAHAQQKGFYTMVELPTQMQINNCYGGSYTLRESLTPTQNILRLEKIIKLSSSSKALYLNKYDDIKDCSN